MDGLQVFSHEIGVPPRHLQRRMSERISKNTEIRFG
jgi:hypothetical protein